MWNYWVFAKKLLMKLLAIPLSNQKSVATWLVMRLPELRCSSIQNAHLLPVNSASSSFRALLWLRSLRFYELGKLKLIEQ
jgi:hypothetical protein